MQRIFAAIILIVISPILLIIYLLVRLTSKGQFVFKQKRVGKDFQIFEMYKIRTMKEGAEELRDKLKHLNEANGPVFKIRDDPRLTPIGKLLAHTGLDEILQLINIIKGEMAFVGPRPLPVSEAFKVPKKYRLRFSVLPGMTSLWIIRGAHGLTFKQWMESDLEYVEKKNLLLNLYIIGLTILLITKWIIKKFS